jgi:hypothetical protein
MSSSNDSYLIKLKQAGFPTKSIAAKLSMTEAEVEVRWLELQATAQAFAENGYAKLAEHFNHTMFKYQELGTMFLVLGNTLGNPVTLSDLIPMCQGTPEEVAQRILQNCIVLPRFTSPTPEELLKVTERQANSAN